MPSSCRWKLSILTETSQPSRKSLGNKAGKRGIRPLATPWSRGVWLRQSPVTMWSLLRMPGRQLAHRLARGEVQVLENLGESWLRGQRAPARQPTRGGAGQGATAVRGLAEPAADLAVTRWGRRPSENRSLRPPPAPRPPTVSGPGPRHLPGGLCAGLWKADRFSAAAFSRTVAMAAATGDTTASGDRTA